MIETKRERYIRLLKSKADLDFVELSFDAIKEIIELLEEPLPNSSESPNGWIPCTERPPEESGKYIVTADDGNEKRTSYAQYQKRVKDWVLSGRRAYWKVIAWQPLPEPYRKGAGE